MEFIGIVIAFIFMFFAASEWSSGWDEMENDIAQKVSERIKTDSRS